MARPTRDRTMAIVLAGLSFVLAFVQRPGWASSDTKIDLHVDPQAFVGQVASVWSPSIDFGAVQSAQYGGYLWPMAPFYALLHALGLGPWVTHRLWLGVLFALSAWGILRLFDALIGRPRGVAHLVGAVFYVLNPYTVIFTGRTSVVFLGYAALPWLLLIVHHGIRNVGGWREWRGWWFAAGFALILTSIGGGINGAVVGWMLVGPLVLLIYEPLVRLVRWRDSVTFLVRVGILGTLASLWWIVPLTVHARYGIDFLQFTEQPRTIWSTNSVPEALRLMAYWTSYIGVGFFGANRPLFSEAGTLLFNPAVVFASLLLPAMAILGFAWTRRFRYAPFFLLILLAGMVIETAGFPDGTPSRDAMEWLYRNLPLVRFMRTTQKAAPLVAIGGAGLLGLAAQLAWARLRALGPGRLRSAALIGAPAALAALIALAALPLVRGTAPERQIVWKEIPRAWTQAGADLDRELRPNSRALVLPGQIFANYMWAGTTDAIFPRVTDKPVAVRYETPYSDPHAFDLLATIDGAVQQRRLLPGQLEPLLRLSGTGAVITGSDDDISRSGAVDPVAAAEELAGQGLGRPARSYPPVRRLPPARGDVGPALPLPEVRRYDIPPGRGIVGVEPAGPATVVDGSAAGLAGLAAFGALPERRPILYAGDLTQGQLRSTVRDGAEVVVTDSNRRRRFLPEFSQQSLGPTLTEGQQFDENNAVVEPFPDRGTDAQTVAVLRGAKALSAPDEGGLLLFPEHAPFAAFDGDRETMWAADRYLKPDKRWIQVDFNRPRDVPWIELEPVGDVFGIEREVEVGGVRARIRPGVNRIRLGLRDVSALRVTITDVDQPSGNLRGSGGFREIRIPGLHVRQLLRTPVLSARALAGQDLSRTTLTYLFERTTGDQPFLRDRQTGSPLLELARDRSDAEQEIDRTIFAPERRSYALEAWVHPAVDASDSALDELAGLDGDARFESSGRFHNQPRFRASSAFDGRAGSAWMGIWARPSAPFPWISWRTAEPQAVSRLRLVPARGGVRRPTRVRVSFPGGATPVLAVGADGAVRLPRPVRSRSFRLTVMDARLPEGVGRDRATRAVGIASLEVPGLAPATPRTTGRIGAPCGAVRVDAGGRTASLRPHGTVEALDAGLPLRASGCGGDVAMGEGVQLVRTLPGTFSTDLLMLRSAAAAASPAPSGGGVVVDPGKIGNSSVDGAQVRLSGPSWLVLGQSYSEGWEATCDGRDLGAPVPINAYANGWRAPADCRQVDFTFAPQASARVSYVISGAVCLLLALFMAVAWLRRRGRVADAAGLPGAGGPPDIEFAPLRRLSLPRAAAVAAAVTVPIALLFALRTSVVVFPLLTVLLWRGVGARPLTLAAGAIFGAGVPLLYAIQSPKDRGGFNFEYSTETIWAHWLGVAGLVVLMLACALTLVSVRRAGRP